MTEVEKMSSASTRDWYNRLSSVYDRLSDSSERPARLRGLKLINAQPGERVLEIGFGTGHGVIALAHAVGPTGEVSGIDLADRMAEVAQARVDSEGVSSWVRLRVGDARKLPYAANSFDAVFMSFTLELFDDREIPLVLSEAKRVLRSGGRITTVALSKEPGQTVSTRIYEKLHDWFPRYVDCHPIDVEGALADAGFEIRTQENFSLWGIAGRVVLGVAT